MKSSPRATRRHGESHTAASASVGGDDDGDGDDRFEISLPHPLVLRVIARSVLLTAAVLAFPWLRSMMPPAANADSTLSPAHRWADEPFFLPMLLRDLKREGLLFAGAHGSAVHLGIPGARFALLKQNKIVPIMSEIGRMAVSDRSVDFVLATDGFTDASFEFIERVVRIGGITIIRLNSDPKHILRLPPNYRIVYVRRFRATVVGIKKVAHAITTQKGKNAADFMGIGIGRRLLAVPESKASSMSGAVNDAAELESKSFSASKSNIDVLNRFEEAFLKPPFDDEEFLENHKKRAAYQPDLLGNSGPPGTAVGQECLTKPSNSKFEITRLDVMEERKEPVQSQRGSGVVGKNVKEGEAEPVASEEMLKKTTTGLFGGEP